MLSIILKLGKLCLAICSALLVELSFEGNRFSKTNALFAISCAILVFAIVSMVAPKTKKELNK